MSITRLQQARQMYALGQRVGFQGGGRDSGGIADSQGNVGSSFGGNEGGYSPPDDRSTAQQTANTRAAIAAAQRENRIADMEKFINRPKYGFTDAAQTNLLSPRSLAATAFGVLTGIPGLGFLSNLSVNPTSTVPYDSKTRGGEKGIIPILPTTFTDYYANVDVDDDEIVDEVQDFIPRFQGANETLNPQVLGLQDTDQLRAMIEERVKNLYT